MSSSAAAAQSALHIPWEQALFPHLSWAEKVVRPLLVYGGLLVLFRLGAKRALAQATLFDFLVLLLISNVVQNAMIGDDDSVLGAGAGALVLVMMSTGLSRLAAGNRATRHLLEGRAEMLVTGGVIDRGTMLRHHLSDGELKLAVRKAGFCRFEDVGFAVLELDGTISVMGRSGMDDRRPPTALPGDLAGRGHDDGDN